MTHWGAQPKTNLRATVPRTAVRLSFSFQASTHLSTTRLLLHDASHAWRSARTTELWYTRDRGELLQTRSCGGGGGLSAGAKTNITNTQHTPLCVLSVPESTRVSRVTRVSHSRVPFPSQHQLSASFLKGASLDSGLLLPLSLSVCAVLLKPF